MLRGAIAVLALCALAGVAHADDAKTTAEPTTVESDVTIPTSGDDVNCTAVSKKAQCDKAEACDWDDDDKKCGTAAGGGGAVDLTTSEAPTTGGAGVGDGGEGATQCEELEGEACVESDSCKWENVTLACSSNNADSGNSDSTETLCPDIISETKCGTEAGCAWSVDDSSCETDNNVNGGGTCSEYDKIERACTVIEEKAKCKDQCVWDDRGSSCAKDDDYDPNSCPAADTKAKCDALAPGNQGVKATGCTWQEVGNKAACEKVSSEDSGSDGEGGDSGPCDGIENEDDCNAVGQAEDDEADDETGGGGAGDAGVGCEWQAGGDGESGGTTNCFKYTDETECNAAINEDNNKRACEWEEPSDDGSDGAGDNDVSQSDEEEQNCKEYDYCTEITDEGECDDEIMCTFKDNQCQMMGDNDEDGCPAQEDKQTCDAFTGEDNLGTGAADDNPNAGGDDDDAPAGDDNSNPLGDDDDGNGNPQCLWLVVDIAQCTTKDPCTKFNGQEAKCKPQGTQECDWDAGQQTCADIALALVPQCQVSSDEEDPEAKCKGAKDDDGNLACQWNEGQDASCINFVTCLYDDEDSCEAAEDKDGDLEGCYWDGKYGGCKPGQRPTTTTTITTFTTTSKTVTTTTPFKCDTRVEVMCASGDECVKKEYWCDNGAPDCKDGSDEEEGMCTTKTTTEQAHECRVGELPCATQDTGAKCFQRDWQCDGDADCDDGTDEKDCESTKKPVAKTTTSTTTTVTTSSTTTTRTTSTTTTTAPACVTGQDCLTMDEFYDASSRDPLYGTPAKCRACVQDRTVDQVCADTATIGCPGAVAPSTEVTQAQRNAAFKAKTLRVKPPFGVSDADIASTLLQRLPIIACQSAKDATTCQAQVTKGLIDVDLEERSGSEYKAVVCYVTKISGIWVQIDEMRKETEIDVGGKVVTIYNSKLIEVDAEDGPKVKANAGAADDYSDYNFDPSMAGEVDYYFPTFDGLTGASLADLELVAVGFGIATDLYTDDLQGLRTAVMVENANRIVADQMQNKGYIAPSAIGSVSNADVQAVFAEALGENMVGVQKSLVMSMLQTANEGLMDAAAQKLADTPSNNGGTEASSGGGKTAVVIILILIAIGIAGGFFMFIKKRKESQGPRHGKMTNSKYENGGETANPSFKGGTPSWADPTVPFLSRQESEAQIKGNGARDKSFVVRQSSSVVQGYIITSFNDGKFSNIQLKRERGALYYGTANVGSNLGAAIQALQGQTPIAPQGAPTYFLGQQVQGGGMDMGGEAAC